MDIKAVIKKLLFSLFILINALSICPVSAQDQIYSPINIEFFYEHGCSECDYVLNIIMPEIENSYAGLYTFEKYDISEEKNYYKLVAYQNKLDRTSNSPATIVVDHKYLLSGTVLIKKDLKAVVDQAISEQIDQGKTQPLPDTQQKIVSAQSDSKILTDRLAHFTIIGIMLAGLLDGINPCAISTLIFFLSLLAILKIPSRLLIMVGAIFCMASFLTYTAIGLGLLKGLYMLSGFTAFKNIFEKFMISVLIIISSISLLDAIKYSKSNAPKSVTLKLPSFLKNKIHQIMKNKLTLKNLIPGAFIIGVVVTIIESVCTGQVYIPTLILLAKSGKETATAIPYLILYNIMFTLPILIVFLMTCKGLSSPQLIALSKKNVVISKLFMSACFAIMAILIAVL